MQLITILDFIIMAILLGFVYSFFKKTDAIKIFLGFVIWFIVYVIFEQFGLLRTAYMMEQAFQMMSLGLMVIFHQELRLFLKRIGGFANFKETENEDEVVLREIKKAVFEMSKNNTGALIILDYSGIGIFDNGTLLNARCSNELIENVFFKNSPLHDGAMIIRKNEIYSAGVKLPFSGNENPELGYLGTRHHVALETSKNSDMKILIVSEETGGISVAYQNSLYKINSKQEFDDFFGLDSK